MADNKDKRDQTDLDFGSGAFDDENIKDVIIEDEEAELGVSDSDDGIFAPVPPKRKSNGAASVVLGILVIGLLAGGGYYLLTNQAMMESLGLASPKSAPATPDVSQTADAPVVSDEVPQPQSITNSDATTAGTTDQVTTDATTDTSTATDMTAATDTAAAVTPETPVTDSATPETPAVDGTSSSMPEAPPADPAATDASATTTTPAPEETTTSATPATETPPAADTAATPSTDTTPAPVSEAPAAPTPSETELTPPAEAAASSVTDAATTGKAPAPSVATETTPVMPPVSSNPQALVYYDAAPGQMQDSGPRRVDPVTEPGQTYVVVSKQAGPQEVESMIIAANRALKLGRYDAALGFYEKLYKANPRDPRILMGRAVTYQKLGQNERAIAAYDDVLTVSPKNADALVNMVGLVRGQYPAVALQKLLDMRQKYPEHAGIASQIGVTYADLDNFEDAIRYLNLAANLEPQNPQHFFNVAVMAERTGKRDLAVQMYEKTLDVAASTSMPTTITRETIYDRLAKLRR